jgi:hypothetical protein
MKTTRLPVGIIVSMLVICCSLASMPAANATGFLDKLNGALKQLSKPAQAQPAQTPRGSTSNVASTQSAPTGAPGLSISPAAAAISAPPSMVDLMKAIPDLSAGGFKLGMPRNEAIAKLKAAGFFAAPRTRPQVSFKFQQLPNQTFIGGSDGLKVEPQVGYQNPGQETLNLIFATDPARPVVVGIQREVDYAASEAPTLGNTLAALRHKYGPESGTDPVYGDLYWLFDYRGQPLSTAQVAHLREDHCADDLMASRAYSRLADPATAIGVGYAESLGGISAPGGRDNHIDPSCFEVIHVEAILSVRTLQQAYVPIESAADWATHSADIVAGITVTIRDQPLENSVYTATRNLVLHAAAQQEQQEARKASKNKPIL